MTLRCHEISSQIAGMQVATQSTQSLSGKRHRLKNEVGKFLAQMERSIIRDYHAEEWVIPDYASLRPGYGTIGFFKLAGSTPT
jgi:hypothetical protein